MQVPEPLHVDGFVKLPFVQVPGAHCVPDGQSRQLPVPSQVPSRPQLVIACALQLRAPLGAIPAPTLVQIPRLPGTLHAWQVLPQVVSQQYPSMQLPVSHVSPAAHACP